MRRHCLFALVIVASVSTAHAAALPGELNNRYKQEAPYGEGALKFLLIKAYTAALYTDAPTWSYEAPFALAITYHMNFTREELADRTIVEMVKQAPLEPAEQKGHRAFFDKAFVDVKDGDRITATYAPGGKLRLYHNGVRTGEITDDALARRFFDIWLGEKTSEPGLREKLLKGRGA
jgi:hypothetical protein